MPYTFRKSFLLSGLHRGFPEIAGLFVLILCSSSFTYLLQGLCPNVRWLSTAALFLVVAMLGICPIFLEIPQLAVLQWLFPPSYYLLGFTQPAVLGYGLLYSALCVCSALLLKRIFPQK